MRQFLTNACHFFLNAGLTDEEVELAIQRVGSTDEPLAVTVPGPGHIIHPLPLSPVPYSEYYPQSSVWIGGRPRNPSTHPLLCVFHAEMLLKHDSSSLVDFLEQMVRDYIK